MTDNVETAPAPEALADEATAAAEAGLGAGGAGDGGAGAGGAADRGAATGIAGDAEQGTGDELADSADGADSTDDADSADGADDEHDALVAEGDAAGDYLERLLDILDYDGDIDLDVEGERAVVSIVGDGDVERLVGEHGEVLSALQELTRLAAGMETGSRSRLMLDIAGYRAKRREELTALGRETAEQVAETGRPARLGAMNPFERKVVHDAVATVAGVTSSSEGEEPRRRVVVSPIA